MVNFDNRQLTSLILASQSAASSALWHLSSVQTMLELGLSLRPRPMSSSSISASTTSIIPRWRLSGQSVSLPAPDPPPAPAPVSSSSWVKLAGNQWQRLPPKSPRHQPPSGFWIVTLVMSAPAGKLSSSSRRALYSNVARAHSELVKSAGSM